jgi:benzoate transport
VQSQIVQESIPLPIPSDKEQKKTLIGAVLGHAADGLDVFILSFVLSRIITDFHLTTAQAGNLTLVTTIGTLCGSYLFGFLGDIFGRVRVFTFTILIYSVATILISFTTDYYQLAILRFFIGLGIGGEFGIGMTLVTETWKPKLRARVTSLVMMGWQFGVLAASYLVAIIVPKFGWHAVFLVGIVPALLAAYFRSSLKEPDIWKNLNRRKKELGKLAEQKQLSSEDQAQFKELSEFPLKKLFATKRLTALTIALMIMALIQNFGYYGIFSWMPTMLEKTYHYSLTKASGWLTISTIGMLFGIALFGFLADSLGRKRTFQLYYIGGTLYCFLYFFVFKSEEALLWGSFFLGFFVNGMVGGFGAILAELYKSEARATAENFIYGTGRGLAGFGPAIIGYMAASSGNLLGAMSLIFLIYPIGLLVVSTMVPETKGIELK